MTMRSGCPIAFTHVQAGYSQLGTALGSGGETMPTFQFHEISPSARRRQTTSS